MIGNQNLDAVGIEPTASRGKVNFVSYDAELADYRKRQLQKDVEWRKQEQARVAELERKAAAYDAIMKAETARPWGLTELAHMTAYANGWAAAASERADSEFIDEWVTYAADVDIHFRTNDDELSEAYGKLEALGYRRIFRPNVGDHDCTDEVKLI